MAPVPAAVQNRPLPPVEGRETSDEELFEQLRAGDEAAFRMLVARHRPWLVRLGTRLLGNDVHAAEDLAQESLLKLHAAARRDRGPLRVRPWLAVVARNASVDEHRRRRPELPGDLPEAPVDDGMFMLDPALSRAWSTLGGRHREVLYLRELMGMSYREIATVMGLSHSAVETLLFRARAALRREYERAGGSRFGCGVLGLGLYRFATGGRQGGAGAHVAGCEACNRAVEGFGGLGPSPAGAALSTGDGGWSRPSPSGSPPAGPAGGGLNLAGGSDLAGVPSPLWTSLVQSEPLLAKVLSAGAAMAATLIPAVVTGSLATRPADPVPRPPAAAAAAPAAPAPEPPTPAPTGTRGVAADKASASPMDGAGAAPAAAAVTIPAGPAEDETEPFDATALDPDPSGDMGGGEAGGEPRLDTTALAPAPPRDSIPRPLATRPNVRDRLRAAGMQAPVPVPAPEPVRDPTGGERLAGMLRRLAPEVPFPEPAVVPAAGIPSGSRAGAEDGFDPGAAPTPTEELPAAAPYLRWSRWDPDVMAGGLGNEGRDGTATIELEEG